jgi:hypothetical protein
LEEKDEFKTELLKKGEEKAFFDLLRTCFGMGESENGFFRWKYEQYPWPVLENTVVVRRGDRLAGAISLWPMKIKVNGDHTLDIMVAGGAATDPQFREKGVWWKYMEGARQLSKERQATLLFGYVTSTAPTYKARVKRGAKELFSQNYHIKILNYPNFFRSAFQSREFQNAMRLSDLGEKIRGLDERILIKPKDEASFYIIIKNGEIKIEEESAEKPTITVKGEISRLIYAREMRDVIKMILTGKVQVKFSLRKVRRVYGVFKVLRRAL